MKDNLEPPPTPSTGDKLAEIGRAAFADVPIPGTGATVEIFRQVFGTAYQRRQEAWTRRLYSLVRELQERGFDIEELATRDEFVTAVHDASRIAIGEHLEEKLDLLQAVLFNAATRPQDEVADLWTLRYLRWIDELEPQHVAVLQFAVDPRKWLREAGIPQPDYMSGPRRTVLGLASFPFPDEQLSIVLEDLRSLGLADVGSGVVAGQAMYDPWISDRGNRFLGWLSIV